MSVEKPVWTWLSSEKLRARFGLDEAGPEETYTNTYRMIVPGGWLYRVVRHGLPNTLESMVFVPAPADYTNADMHVVPGENP